MLPDAKYSKQNKYHIKTLIPKRRKIPKQEIKTAKKEI